MLFFFAAVEHHFFGEISAKVFLCHASNIFTHVLSTPMHPYQLTLVLAPPPPDVRLRCPGCCPRRTPLHVGGDLRHAGRQRAPQGRLAHRLAGRWGRGQPPHLLPPAQERYQEANFGQPRTP